MNAAQLFVRSQCWAINSDYVDTLLSRAGENFIGAHSAVGADGVPAFETQVERRASVRSAAGGIAVIPVRGPLIHRMDAMMEWWLGATSTERIVGYAKRAAADDSIGSIVLDIDSPGGTVSGLEEAAAAIHSLRDSKQIIAVANAEADSAAYYLGAAASVFVATPSAMVGSIGTIWPLVDETKAMEDAGIKVTIIRAGENKARINPYEPLTEAAAADAQAIVDGYYADFVRDVAKYRDKKKSVVESDFGQGRSMRAAEAASVGMIDRVATMAEVLEKIAKKRSNAAGAGADTDIRRRRAAIAEFS